MPSQDSACIEMENRYLIGSISYQHNERTSYLEYQRTANSLQGDLNAAFLFLYYSIFCKSRVIPGLHCKTKWPKSKEFFINHIERANFRGASRRQPNQVGILRIMPSHDSACIEMEDRELKWCDQYNERTSFLEFQPSTLGQGTSMWYPRCSFLINKKVDEFRNWKIKWPKSEEFFIWTPPYLT
jgi:hypothetical protein